MNESTVMITKASIVECLKVIVKSLKQIKKQLFISKCSF